MIKLRHLTALPILGIAATLAAGQVYQAVKASSAPHRAGTNTGFTGKQANTKPVVWSAVDRPSNRAKSGVVDTLNNELVLGMHPESDKPGQVARAVSSFGKVVNWTPKEHSYRIRLAANASYSNSFNRLKNLPGSMYVRPVVTVGGQLAEDLQSVDGAQRYMNLLKARRMQMAKAMGVVDTGDEEEDEKPGSLTSKLPKVDFLGAYLHWLRQRAEPDGKIDWSKYKRAVAARDAMAPAPRDRFAGGGKSGGLQVLAGDGISPAAAGKSLWEFIGPRDYSSYSGPNTGRLNATAYDPQNPNKIFVGAAGGGVWRSFDGGTNFSPLSDTWKFMAISCIAIDPQNTDNIYVGTGDDPVFSFGFGIMKSTDGGDTWTNIGTADFPNQVVHQIMVDPDTPNVVVAVTSLPGPFGPDPTSKIWRSDDKGATWTAVKTTTNTDLPVNYWVTGTISVPDALGNRYYFVAALDNTSLYRSSDKGKTWVRLVTPYFDPAQPTRFPPVQGIKLGNSPTNKDAIYAIVYMDDGTTQVKRIFKSADAGTTWTDITNGLDTAADWSQAWYDIFITVSTTINGEGNPQDVTYPGLIDLIQSPDEGYQWRSVGKVYQAGARIHPDQHALTVNPFDPEDLLLGNDGGLYRVHYDSLFDSITFTPMNLSLHVMQFYHIAIHPSNPDYLLGGTQDNGTPHSFGDLQHWVAVSGGDGGDCTIHPLNPLVQTSSSQSSGVKATTSIPIYRTEDGWNSSRSIALNASGDAADFIPPHAVSPANSNWVYAASSYLYRYDAVAKSWSRRLGNANNPNGAPPGSKLAGGPDPNPLDFNYITCLQIAPTDSGRIYTGSTDGQVWMTTDAGTSFTRINTGNPGVPFRHTTSLSIHPTNPNDLLVGNTTGVYHCTNVRLLPRNYVNITNNLPMVANSLARDIFDPDNTYYAGTDVGVFMTTNGGANWTNATNPLGLPNVQVNELKTFKNGSGLAYLYAGTYGRGIWRIKLADGKVVLTGLTLNPPSVCNGQDSTATLTTLNPVIGNTVVNLTSSDPALVTVPATVTIPDGQSSVTFTVKTKPVAVATPVTITAKFATSTVSTVITLTPFAIQSLSLSVNPPAQGIPAVATVGLTCPAAVDTVVTLKSSNTAVATVPDTVTVPAGSSVASFQINIKDGTNGLSDTVTATLNGVSKSVTFNVTKFLNTLSINPSSIFAGETATATLTFNVPSPAGGITLSTTVAVPSAVTLPATLNVPGGVSSYTFAITGNNVATLTTTGVTVKRPVPNDESATSVITVKPIIASSLVLNPSSVKGGDSSTGTVTLNANALPAGAVVSLTSSNPTVAPVPATITVAGGQASKSFVITTTPVVTLTTVTITASFGGATVSATLTVFPPVSPSQVTVSPNPACANSFSLGTVNLDVPALKQITVTLTSSDPTAATVPATLVIPAGQSSKGFTVTTKDITFDKNVVISVSFAGVTRNTNLTVLAPVLTGATVTPVTVKGGKTTQLTLNISCPAPTGGGFVSMSSSNPAVVPVAASYKIVQGTYAGSYTINTKGVVQTTVVTLTASYNGSIKTVTVVVTP